MRHINQNDCTQEIILEDFSEASEILGRGNGFLPMIGGHYGCAISGRGNFIRITGTREKVDKCAAVIGELRRLAHEHTTLTDHHVKFCMRMLDRGNEEELHEMSEDVINVTRSGKVIKPRTLGQKRYVDMIRHKTITFGIGPAGTGKTYLAVALGAYYLRNHEVERIILVRPAVEAGEKLGFLPGDLQEKVNPYLRPLFDGLMDMFGAEDFSRLQQHGAIEVAPLAYMRGRTLEKSFIILDEAQNTTIEQIKMFLTRLGFHSKMVINGDITQIDLPFHIKSGLIDAKRVLEHIDGIGMMEFTSEDVVRHDLVAAIVRAYEEDSKKKEKTRRQNDGDYRQLQ